MAKRRRPSDTNSDLKRAKSAEEVDNSEFSDVLRQIKESENVENAKKYAKRLKQLLTDEGKIKKFVIVSSNIEELVGIFCKQTTVMGTSEYRSEIHQYSISILANCCFTIPKTGFLIRKAKSNFLDLSVRIFESTIANPDVKSSMCRLLANLCSNKDLVMTWISSNTIIFDQIALLLESSDLKIVKQCLRIFSMLANSSFTRENVVSGMSMILETSS
ncbi:unnamed protein product [Caenorhabditis angaria]|uniref:Uncharacterized protein n=1 Tax=Caenorhabditis angaria TaxID=860376 RepID=A0A9P1I6A1_9PELO|nr:unnamed protein product [Caenorhabditis angaria]